MQTIYGEKLCNTSAGWNREIPEGNLFDDVDHGARSEVYVMGNRNPFRISVDPKTGYLYWGEVGPMRWAT